MSIERKFSADPFTAPRQRVMLLDADPDITEGISSAELEVARHHAVANVIQVDPPTWNPAPIVNASEPGWLGLFQLDGLMLRRVQVGKRRHVSCLDLGT